MSWTGLARAAVPASETHEYAIKAAALYNVVPFVDWPESAFPASTAPLVIGVLGRDPFGELLDRLVANETFHGRPIVVEHYPSVDLIKDCQLLFVARSEQRNWPAIERAVARRPILTVSDAENFASRGGSIQFSTVRNKLRIVVNVQVIHRAGITVSSKLLRLAEVVGEARP